MLAAISAASIRNVPEPHMGSTKGVSPRQPVMSMMPAASTSLMGASVCANAVAALVQRLARRVEAQDDFLARYMYVDEDVGVLEAHAGAASLGVTVAKPVDYGVLYLICDEAAVAKFLAVAHRVDRECLLGAEQAAPVEFLDVVVERVGVGGAEFIERPQDAQGGAAL